MTNLYIIQFLELVDSIFLVFHCDKLSTLITELSFSMSKVMMKAKLTNSLKWRRIMNYSIFQQLYWNFEQMAIK